MKWLIPILAMLLLVGCRRNEVIPVSVQWGFHPHGRAGFYPDPVSDRIDPTVSTNREGVVHQESRQRWVQSPRQPALQQQPTKDEQVQEVPAAEKNYNPNDQFRSVKDSQAQKDVPDAPRRKFRWYVDPSRKDADGNFIRVRIYEDEEK